MLSKQHNLPPIKITFKQLACVAFKRGVEGNLGVSLPREEVGGRSSLLPFLKYLLRFLHSWNLLPLSLPLKPLPSRLSINEYQQSNLNIQLCTDCETLSMLRPLQDVPIKKKHLNNKNDYLLFAVFLFLFATLLFFFSDTPFPLFLLVKTRQKRYQVPYQKNEILISMFPH